MARPHRRTPHRRARRARGDRHHRHATSPPLRTGPIEVTYLHGRAIVAYVQLSASVPRRVMRTEALEPGLVVDFGPRGVPLRLEIVDPPRTPLAAVNRVLRKLRRAAISRRDLGPLRVA